MLPIEELSRPRVKIIAPYIHSPYEVGNFAEISGSLHYVLTRTSDTDHSYPIETVRAYPNLFEEVEWYAGRKVEDMPDYLKHIDNEVPIQNVEKYVEKVVSYIFRKEDSEIWAFEYRLSDERITRMSIAGWLPATEQEYIEHNKS